MAFNFMHNHPFSCKGCKVLDPFSKENYLFLLYNNECIMPSHLRQGCPCPKCIEKNCPRTDAHATYPCKKFREIQEISVSVSAYSSCPVYDDIH